MQLQDLINLSTKCSLSEMTMNTKSLPQHVVDGYVSHLEKHGKKWADASGGKVVDKITYKGMDIYGLRDADGDLISFVTFKPTTLNKKEFYELYVISTISNKGGGFYPQLTLLWTIKEHIKTPIIYYGSQTPEGKRFIQAIDKTGRFDIFWYNIKTRKRERYEGSNDADESKYRGETMTDWRVVVEHSSQPAFPKDSLRGGFPFGIPYELFEKEEFPSVKTHPVEHIVKKHGVSLAKINAQLKKGIRVEHEHTKNAAKAKEIALDHLWEHPDYYDRLEKVEK